MLDYKKCEVFTTIVEEKNLTKAAERLGYTQPGISNIVRSIEEEIGFAIFYRHHNGITLTKEAELLLPQIYTVLANYKSINQTIDSIKGINEGHIRIGSYSSMSISYLTKWIEDFSIKYPNITFSIIEGGYKELENGLDSFKIDMAFFSRQPWHKYKWTHIADDPIVVALPGDTNFKKKCFKLSDFDNKALIYHEDGSDPDAEKIIKAIKDNNISPIYKYCIFFDRTMMSMVEHHLGIGIFPKLVTSHYQGNIKCLPFHPAVSRELGIATLPDIPQSPAVKLFIDYCVSNIE